MNELLAQCMCIILAKKVEFPHFLSAEGRSWDASHTLTNDELQRAKEEAQKIIKAATS